MAKTPARTLTRKVARALATGALLASLMSAEAALIDFENLPVTNPPEHPYDFYGNPIPANAYASQGLLITDGYLWPVDYPLSQTLRPTSDTRFAFTGTLPTFVSMTVHWLPEDILDIRASGPSGYAATFHSFGYGDGPSVPPGFGDEVIRFASPSGISSLSFAGSSFMRFPARIDDLYFGAVPAVPEPAPLVLAGIGLLLLVSGRRWLRPRVRRTPRGTPPRSAGTPSVSA